ncbi:DUF58 domain-containing protein [Cellulomonas sp. URHB0016]
MGLTLVGLVALGLGLLAGYPGLVALGVAAVGLVVAATVALVAPAPLDVTHRLLATSTPRRGRAVAHLELRNASRWMPLVVAGVEQVAGRDVALVPRRLTPGESGDVEVTVPTDRRGLVTVGPFVLERRAPADLVRSRDLLGGSSTLRVTPRVLAVDGPPLGRRRGHEGGSARVERGGTDLVGMREYVPGDDLRRVHWAGSARAGVPMVRDDADPAEAHLTVLLDDRSAAYPVEPADDGFEEAVDVAASLVRACVDAGVPVRCVTASGSVDLDLPAGPPGGDGPSWGAGRSLDALTLAATTGAPTDPLETSPVALAPLSAAGPAAIDVLAVVTGTGAALAPLLLAGRGAATTVVLVVDPAPDRVLGTAEAAVVVRGPRAEDLLRGWDLVAAG